MLKPEEHYELLVLEDENRCTYLAYCANYEAEADGAARIGNKLFKIIARENYVSGAAICMIGAEECDAIYSQTWERKEDEATEASDKEEK